MTQARQSAAVREAMISATLESLEQLREYFLELDVALRDARLSDGAANVSPWIDAQVSAFYVVKHARAIERACRLLSRPSR